MTEEYLKQLGPCPACGEHDLRWCSISVRPFCRHEHCQYTIGVNHGTAEDAIRDWNEASARAQYQQGALDGYPKLYANIWALVHTSQGANLADMQRAIMKNMLALMPEPPQQQIATVLSEGVIEYGKNEQMKDRLMSDIEHEFASAYKQITGMPANIHLGDHGVMHRRRFFDAGVEFAKKSLEAPASDHPKFRIIELTRQNENISHSLRLTEKHLEEYRDAHRIIALTERGDVWYWQGDNMDYPESISCPVVMQPEKLRALLELVKPTEGMLRGIKELNVKLKMAEARLAIYRHARPDMTAETRNWIDSHMRELTQGFEHFPADPLCLLGNMVNASDLGHLIYLLVPRMKAGQFGIAEAEAIQAAWVKTMDDRMNSMLAHLGVDPRPPLAYAFCLRGMTGEVTAFVPDAKQAQECIDANCQQHPEARAFPIGVVPGVILTHKKE